MESQIHVLYSTVYTELREVLNLTKQEDIVKYYREVLAFRAVTVESMWVWTVDYIVIYVTPQ